MEDPAAPPAPEPISPALTPEQTQKAVRWLEANWGTAAPCPFHGPTTWEVGNVLVGTVGYQSGGLAIGGPTYPSFVVVCGRCGFTVFVNALKAGIVPRQPVPPESEPAPESPEGQ